MYLILSLPCSYFVCILKFCSTAPQHIPLVKPLIAISYNKKIGGNTNISWYKYKESVFFVYQGKKFVPLLNLIVSRLFSYLQYLWHLGSTRVIIVAALSDVTINDDLVEEEAYMNELEVFFLANISKDENTGIGVLQLEIL